MLIDYHERMVLRFYPDSRCAQQLKFRIEWLRFKRELSRTKLVKMIDKFFES